MGQRTLFLCLAVSPVLFVICVVCFGLAFNNLLGSLAGDVAILVPLVWLDFTPAVAERLRRGLIVATASFALLVPAIALYFAPTYAMRFNKSVAQIRLDPPPHAMPADGAAFLRGLSVKDGVMILRWSPNDAAGHPSPYSACDYSDWHDPPSHFSDENGNGLDFTLLGPDLLRFKDDCGGYADVKWDGSQFQLVASHSAGQAARAKSPGNAAIKLREIGNLLLILTPSLAWLALTYVTWLHDHQTGRLSPLPALAAVLQGLGMLGLGVAILGSGSAHDEVSGGLSALVVVASAITSLVGLAILGWKLARIRNRATD